MNSLRIKSILMSLKDSVRRISKSERFAWIRYFYTLLRLSRRFLKARKIYQERRVAVVSERSWNYFHGYYDRSAFHPSKPEYILLHRTKAKIWRKPNPKEKLQVVIYNWQLGKVEKIIGETLAWNWQQGARALWLSDTEVIFNIFSVESNSYRAVRWCWLSDELSEVGPPVQEIIDCKYYLSIDYIALALFRPDYGYFCIRPSADELKDYGIVICDISTGGSQKLVFKRDMEGLISRGTLSEASWSKFNHVSVSPSGDAFIFMFRYMSGEGQRITDVFVYSFSSKTVRILLPDLGVSHYCWISDNEVLYSGRNPSDVASFGLGVVRVTDASVRWLRDMHDGHPHQVSDSKFVYDSYSDAQGVKSLKCMSVSGSNVEDEVLLLESIEPWYLPTQSRCDLHPTVSSDGRLFQIDSVCANKRVVVIGEL